MNTEKSTHIDLATFRKLYDETFEPLCRFLNFYTKDTFLIEDIIQESFIKLWDDKDSMIILHPKSYLYKTVRNRLMNYFRDEKNRMLLLESWYNNEIEDQKSEDCYDIDEFVNNLHNATNTLPPKCREIFILSKQYQLTYNEIAELNNISVKTVENQMGIALKKLRQNLSIDQRKNENK